MNIYKLVIITFLITATWDVLLRIMSDNYYSLPTSMQYDFVRYLRLYFKKHTTMSAASIAGIIGAITQVLIMQFSNIPKKILSVDTLRFLLISFAISGLLGFPIKWSGLFPYLNEYYYKPLGDIRGAYHDGISGLIVQGTILLILTC